MRKINQLPLSERPREKGLLNGVQSLSNRELLAILIRNGTKGYSCLQIADEIISKSNGLRDLLKFQLNDYISIKGISKIKALELLSWMELMNRVFYQECIQLDVVSNPKSLIKWCNVKIGLIQQEQFLVIFLNVKNEIINYKVIFQGTLDQSLVHPREIFKEAISLSTSKIILVHNHPSSHVEPSQADLLVTRNLCEIGKMMKIPIVDHIIVSERNYFSFKEHDLL